MAVFMTATLSYGYDFSYTFEGKALNYSKTSNDQKCYVAAGKISGWVRENNVEGDVVIPDIAYHNGEPYEVVGIDECAFSYCQNLTSLTIPKSIHIVFDYALIGCFGLKNLIFKDSENPIEVSTGCFDHLELDSLYMGRNITHRLPYNHTHFPDYYPKKIEIGNLASEISEDLFAFSGISYITIPISVRNIAEYAFSGCKNLQEVRVMSSLPPDAHPKAFLTVYENATLVVPEGSLSNYRNAKDTCWPLFYKIKEESNSTSVLSISREDRNNTKFD